ncbi:MAG: sulfite exporter TauE/SafE family protein [Anaerolineae bacterium]|nr:sulfite exporter TauE/SafE family protein [Anaerolineae bacterium]
MIVGFLAQIIDGSLGMAYGVSSTTFLLSSGVSPAVASASVHTAQVFTTLVSGLSHLRLGNVDKSLFRRLLIPGMLGGVLGAYVLSQLPGDKIKPLVAVYLALMGIRILWKAFRQSPTAQQVVSHLFPLGIIGGFFDAIGGGGWGPIVTSTLIARGNHPRYTIGSVNLTEFFVTLSETLTFVLAFNLFDYGKVITGLILGGVLAAPMAAYVCKYLPPRALMIIVGCLIVLLSVRTVLLTI